MNKRKHVLFLLTVPAMLMVLLFIAVPLVNAVRISFFKWNGYSQSMKWIGLNNYTKIFSDRWFGISFWNTMLYGFGSTLLQNILGLLAALYVNKNFRGRNAMRVIMYMPIMISAFLMGKIMYFFFQYDGGVFNEMLSLLQLNPVFWTESGTSSAIIITLVNSWQYMGICMLIYLSGLQGVPIAYREAARLDGANAWQEFHSRGIPVADSGHYNGCCHQPDRWLQDVRCDRILDGRRACEQVHVAVVLYHEIVLHG